MRRSTLILGRSALSSNPIAVPRGIPESRDSRGLAGLRSKLGAASICKVVREFFLRYELERHYSSIDVNVQSFLDDCFPL